MAHKIAIVGSGLAAISLAQALIARGIKPTILDVGETLPPENQAVVDRMATSPPGEWAPEDRAFVASNTTIHDKDSFPQKLAFGSDFFYAESTPGAPTETADVPLPHSYARGGFSVGWGASVLPPDDCDLTDWPLRRRDLEPYFQQVLADRPLSATEDGLSRSFPLYADHGAPLRSTRGVEDLLRRLSAVRSFDPDQIVFGKARLLAQSRQEGDRTGCKYCGLCMSGCVYGSIYKSTSDLARLTGAGQVDYRPGTLVRSVVELGDQVEVDLMQAGRDVQPARFDRVFLAAGAVGSTRIILESKGLFDRQVRLLNPVGFVAPMFRLARSHLEWPHANTLPGAFLEFKVSGLSDHWVHTQLSTPNEMVLDKLGIASADLGLLGRIKKRVADHLVVAHCNMHSNHSNGYVMQLRRGADGASTLVSRREESDLALPAIRQTAKALFGIMRKIGCYSVLPLIQASDRSGGFHLGGTLPMRASPSDALDTNLMGNPLGYSRVHVVDSSLFPSVPGTTVGLVAMANAARIGTEAVLE
ncbi:MAG: GMC oxidoreductase [Pseudomonadota bacterium]